MLLQLFNLAPDILFTSTAFPTAFRVAVSALTLVQPDLIFAALDLIYGLITHDCLLPHSSSPPKFPIYATAIRSAVDEYGLELSGCLLSGITGDYHEETTTQIALTFRTLATYWSPQLLAWLPVILQRLPPTAIPDQAKSEFLAEVTR